MRACAFLSGVLCFIAFILSLLCLFAGNKPGFLDNGYILKIAMSTTGKELLLNGSISGGSSLSSELDSVAANAGISDWYAIHVLNYCKGSYANSSSTATESCSELEPFFSFDPTQVIESEFKDGFNVSLGGLDVGVKLSDSGWPSQIKDVFGNAETAYKVVFLMLCIGIASSGLETIMSVVVFVMGNWTAVSLINFGITAISFLGLGLASAAITGTMFTLVNTINSQGAYIGLEATKGVVFLCMTWAATILTLLTTCIWLLDYCIERRATHRIIRKAADKPGSEENGDKLLQHYRNQEKAFKAEAKALKKRQAAERAMIKAARSVPLEPPVIGFPQPIPELVVRHDAVRLVGNSLDKSSDNGDTIQESKVPQSHPRVIEREFI